MKLNCIIDTCSCIYLSNTVFNQKTVISYLNSEANLKYSKEVSQELRDHRVKNLPNFLFNNKNSIKTSKYSMPEYEKRMLGRNLTSRKKGENKGEIDNFLLSIDQLLSFKINGLIFITDDETALNGILNDWIPSFPLIRVWTSYEVVLFLYSLKKIPSKDIAKELIQDLINFTAPKPNERSEKVRNNLTKTKVDYNKKIDNISKILI